MTPRFAVLLSACALAACPARGWAASAVFQGDPTDASGRPYEILPNKPLVQAGPDGVLGTVDDVVSPTIIGDIDLVVRTGTLSANAIPPPALGNTALLHGVAGPRTAGGSEIPFTVFLSDGALTDDAPAGHPLPASDMNGLPAIVAAFADLDGDGMIGPSVRDQAGYADLALELRELEPVGRTAALFSDGVAHGSLAIQRALPASRGGLHIALVAMALTGPLDPNFFGGAIPSGPAIATALPFLPQRDLNRLIRDRAVPASPTTTLQQLIQFAAVPPPDAYVLPLDGSEPTIDGAIVDAQPAVRVSLRDATLPRDVDVPLDHLLIGTERLASRAFARLVAVDRFDNPADPPPDFAVSVRADGPLHLLAPRELRDGRPLILRRFSGVRIAGRAVTTGSGTIRVERDGIVVATLPYAVDAAANVPPVDVVVPSDAAPRLQDALDAATDVNRDGTVVIAVRPGYYAGALRVEHALQLVGAGRARTVLVGDDRAPVVSADAAGVIIRGLAVIGGASGVALNGNGAQLIDSAAWRNHGAGVLLGGAAASLQHSEVRQNGSDGVRVAPSATGARCSDSALRDNGGFGATVASAANTAWKANQVVLNAGGGMFLDGADGATLGGNRIAANVGVGIELHKAPSAQVANNLCALNDDDGLHIEQSDAVVVTGNQLDDNRGYGLFLRRSNGADFAAAVGVQDPPGDNDASGNRKGDVFVRTD